MRAGSWHACSPTRSSIQSGRLPIHVTVHNSDLYKYNASSASGIGAGMPRNMTGLAEKMSGAGYHTVFAGKWDAGIATPLHTPHGRGYQSAVNYFGHANGYWDERGPGGPNCSVGVDLYDTLGPAWGMNTGPPHGTKVDFYNESAYEEAIFHRRLSAEIEAHDASMPLMVFYAAHLVHEPYQVPQEYLDRMSKAGGGPFDNSTAQATMRMTYHAMVKALDDNVGALVAQFKQKGMWENTLMWFSSDNGGPIYAGGNNFPMRGGKYSEFVCANRRGCSLISPTDGAHQVRGWRARQRLCGRGLDPGCQAGAALRGAGRGSGHLHHPVHPRRGGPPRQVGRRIGAAAGGRAGPQQHVA